MTLYDAKKVIYSIILLEESLLYCQSIKIILHDYHKKNNTFFLDLC